MMPHVALSNNSFVAREQTCAMPAALQVLWREGLIVTFCTLAGGVLLWLVAVYSVQYHTTKRMTLRKDAVQRWQECTSALSSLMSAPAWCRLLWRRSGGATPEPHPGVGSSLGKASESSSEDAQAEREATLQTAVTMLHGGPRVRSTKLQVARSGSFPDQLPLA
jgi:hypothetical protein